MFHVGQKVVCVDGTPPRQDWFGEPLPVRGNIYTVRYVHLSRDGRCGIRLQEILNAGGPCEPVYNIVRFRPITDRKTDISIFKRMLTPSDREVVS